MKFLTIAAIFLSFAAFGESKLDLKSKYLCEVTVKKDNGSIALRNTYRIKLYNGVILRLSDENFIAIGSENIFRETPDMTIALYQDTGDKNVLLAQTVDNYGVSEIALNASEHHGVNVNCSKEK